MEGYRRNVDEAAAYIRSHIDLTPRIGMVLGTGLGGAAECIESAGTISYHEIPHYPVSTVTGHEGRLVCGRWMGQPVLVMQGRFHLYEGYSPRQIAFPIRVMKALRAEILVVCSAAGGLNPLFDPGDLMVVSDHINLTGHNPLIGPNADEWGPRFPDMTEPYGRRLQALALDTAVEEKIPVRRGVYVGVLGPSLETAAETRLLKAAGADAVGMSMVMEVITAVHAGLETLGIAVITNVNLPDHYQPAILEEIIATARKAGPALTRLLAGTIGRL